MDKQSQKKFDALIKVNKSALNRAELEFLMARRDYMTDEQKKMFADEIDAHESGELFPVEKNLEEMNEKELKAYAKSNKIDVKGLKGAEEILGAIREAEAGDEE